MVKFPRDILCLQSELTFFSLLCIAAGEVRELAIKLLLDLYKV